MKLGILSCGPNSYSTRRFKEAAVARGHSVKVLNTMKFAIDLQQCFGYRASQTARGYSS